MSIFGRHYTHHNDIQHNDTQHKGLIYDTQHMPHSAYATISIIDTPHNKALPLCWLSISCVSRFFGAMLSIVVECPYPECRGANICRQSQLYYFYFIFEITWWKNSETFDKRRKISRYLESWGHFNNTSFSLLFTNGPKKFARLFQVNLSSPA
jgi:hypothetical protein